MEERKLLSELQAHNADSDTYISDIRDTWDDKEDLLIGKLTDDLSKNAAKSQVFDPRLSTIAFERAARVSAQLPTGKAYAVSRDDIGKNKVMNLLLSKYIYKNANSQFPMLTKVRLMDLYSLVYGSMFALVDWVVDERREYYGPDFFILNIRDVFPQPGAISIADSDWIQVSTLKSLQWIKERDKKTWKNLDKVIEGVKDSAGKTKDDMDSDRRMSSAREAFPTLTGDKVFPKVELITEYRRDKWITYAPDYNVIVREIENPHNNGKLPIVAKHSFPLIDNIFGLGEFERGKSLQFAINSLINLYLDGVKMSLFPPLQINPDGVVPSTIKWGAGAKWSVKRPNVDIQMMNMSPRGLDTFQSTYQFMVAAMLNQAGTTDTTVSKTTDPGMGKTPQAIDFVKERESARDNWDRYMLEQFLEGITGRFIDLTTEKMERPVILRLIGEEVKEIAKEYPDATEIFESSRRGLRNGRGKVTVNKKMLKSKWDYEIDSGSTMVDDPLSTSKAVNNLLKMVLEHPEIQAEFQQQGKHINVPELVKRSIIDNGIRDWDKIITDLKENPEQQGTQQGPMPQGPQSNFSDPEIARLHDQIMGATGGIGGIPSGR